MGIRGRWTTRRRANGRVDVLLAVCVMLAAVALPGSVLVSPVPADASSASTCGVPAAMTSAEASSQTGVTPNSVTVGNVSIITGPVPGLFEGAPIGVKAYFDYVNSHGGVNGRKLFVNSSDDAFTGQQNETETQEAVGRDFALVGSFSLFDGYGCKVLRRQSGGAGRVGDHRSGHQCTSK